MDARFTTLVGLLAAGIALPSIGAVQAAAQTRDDKGWARVERLEPGTAIDIETRDGRSVVRHIGRSAPDLLVVLNLSDPRLAGPAIRGLLLEVAGDWPDHLVPGGRYEAVPGTRVAPDGVFVGNEKVANAIDIIEVLRRNDIRELRRAGSTRRWWGLGIGGGAGAFAGFVGALNVGLRNCGRSCDDESVMMGGLLVGVPVASALAGYYLGRHHDVIYRGRD